MGRGNGREKAEEEGNALVVALLESLKTAEQCQPDKPALTCSPTPCRSCSSTPCASRPLYA